MEVMKGNPEQTMTLLSAFLRKISDLSVSAMR